MNKLFKLFLALMLIVACILTCVSCENFNGGSNGQGNAGTNEETPGFEDEENSYRIRFVYSYTAKVENESGRLENKQSIITVKSFFIPKDNNGLSSDMIDEMKGLSYHGFSFVNWFTEWDYAEQKGVEGKEFTFDNQPITADITLYCDRSNLAGEDISWEIEKIIEEVVDDNGETQQKQTGAILKLNGSGDMFDFTSANEIDVPWFKYREEITAVEVSDGITSIGNNAFNDLANATSIELPDSIERIGSASFEGVSITKFVAPASLKSIEKNAFNETSLREVVLNEGLETLGERAFYGSNKIKTIVFPSSVKSVPVAVFHPGSVNSKNNKHSLSKVYYLGDAEEFEALDIGMDNTWFEDKATIYYYRENLADDEVGTYWHFAENASTPTAVQYFYTLRYIQGSANTFLCNIYVPVNPVLDENGNILYDEEGLPLLKGVITEEHIRQQNAITYHNYQFASFSGADTLRVDNEITADLTYTCQRGNILSPDGGIKWAFTDKKLSIYIDTETEARISKDVNNRIKDGKLVLTAAEKEILGVNDDEITVTDEIIAEIIAGRLERSLYMWDFVDSYDATSIWTASTTSITIENGIKYIGKFAFTGISRTAEVLIPASVEGIHPDAFSGCTDLISVFYDGSASEDILALSNSRYTVYSKVEAATADPGNYWMNVRNGGIMRRLAWTLDENGTLRIGGDSKMINFADASDAPWYGAKDQIKAVEFASNILEIGENVVNGYTGVEKLYIPGTTRKIPASAFAGTKILTDTSKYVDNLLVVNGHLLKVDHLNFDSNLVETFTGIVTIADGAFVDCGYINSLYIARTIQYIDSKAFGDCKVGAIFADGNADFWKAIGGGASFPESKIYYKHLEEYITIVDENGNSVTIKTSETNDTYWFKSGDEYMIWGCRHIFDETTHVCTNEGCNATDPNYSAE